MDIKKYNFKFITIEDKSSENKLIYSNSFVAVNILEKEYSGRWHIHDCFEFELLLSGEAEVWLDEKKVNAKKNFCWLCLPGSAHNVRLNKGTKLLSVQFSSDYIEQYLVKESMVINSVISELGASECEFLTDLILSSAKTAEKNEVFSNLAFKGLLEYLTAFILSKSDFADFSEQNDIDMTVVKIIRYTKLHIAEQLSVKTLSEIFGYTPNYFSYLFKSRIGMNFTEFLTHERLRLANILLKNSDISVSDIAVQTGFETSAYFCRIYKKTFGKTPKEFRQS